MVEDDNCLSGDILSLFGPEDNIKPQKNKKDKENKKKKKKQINKNEEMLNKLNNNEESVDSLVDLFNPSLEDEGCVADLSEDSDCLSSNLAFQGRRKKGRQKCYQISNSPWDSEDYSLLHDQLPSEPQEGNIEYKLKLVNPNHERFKRLVSQMQWRLREGLGEAIYEIGVEDSGVLMGLTSQELKASMNTLRRMARQLGASLTVIREKTISSLYCEDRTVAEVLVRKVPDDQYSIELRIAVLGNSDVGKSTLLGVLTRGELDNGRGCARLNVFRHRHEVYSGKTSSISLQIMGFDSQGNVIDQTCTRSRDYDDEDICSQSIKIINFIDLAGDEKYLHTTAFGLSGYSPHYAVLVVSAFSGVAPMTREHLSLARAMDVPIVIVVTKTDITSTQQINITLLDLKLTLTQPEYKKVPMLIENEDDAITAGSNQLDSNTVPIFCASSVTGQGLALLKKFLFVLPPKISNKEREKLEQEQSEFQIDEVFHVDHTVVVGGLLKKGVILQGASLLLGPMDNCRFQEVKIASIHRNKVPCRVVYAGQSASLSLTASDVYLRQGMKLVSPELSPQATFFVQAKIRVLNHDSTISRGFQSTIHIGNIRQTAVVEGIMGKVSLHTNDEATVMFRFIRQPELVETGSRLLFRQGLTKGIGHVTQIFPEDPDNMRVYRYHDR